MNLEFYNQTGKIISTEIIEQKFVYAKIKLTVSNLIIEDVIIKSPFGIVAPPTNGSVCIVSCNDQDTSQYYAEVIDTKFVNATENATCIYGKGGNYIFFMDNGDIEIKNATANIKLNGSNIEITGNVKITGNLQVTGNSTLTGNGTSIAGKTFISHTHSGVTAGGANTGGVT